MTREVQTITHEFDATADQVMEVVPAALDQMGFSVTSISNARDEVEAISEIRRDSGFGNSRQTRVKFSVVDRDGGYSLASLTAWDIHEEENARGERFMSESGVVGPGFHNSVFEAIEALLPKQAK